MGTGKSDFVRIGRRALVVATDANCPWFDPSHPMNAVAAPRRFSINELEQLLQREDDIPITILPNGEIRTLTDEERAALPLTLRG